MFSEEISSASNLAVKCYFGSDLYERTRSSNIMSLATGSRVRAIGAKQFNQSLFSAIVSDEGTDDKTQIHVYRLQSENSAWKQIFHEEWEKPKVDKIDFVIINDTLIMVLFVKQNYMDNKSQLMLMHYVIETDSFKDVKYADSLKFLASDGMQCFNYEKAAYITVQEDTKLSVIRIKDDMQNLADPQFIDCRQSKTYDAEVITSDLFPQVIVYQSRVLVITSSGSKSAIYCSIGDSLFDSNAERISPVKIASANLIHHPTCIVHNGLLKIYFIDRDNYYKVIFYDGCSYSPIYDLGYSYSSYQYASVCNYGNDIAYFILE